MFLPSSLSTHYSAMELQTSFLFPAHTSMLSRFSRVRLFATLWTVAHQAPLSTGFSRQEYWSGLLCPPPGDLPDTGIKPTSAATALQEDSLLLSHQGNPIFPRKPLNSTVLLFTSA